MAALNRKVLPDGASQFQHRVISIRRSTHLLLEYQKSKTLRVLGGLHESNLSMNVEQKAIVLFLQIFHVDAGFRGDGSID